MADTTLGNAVVFLQDFGVFTFILPLLLVFAVIYAILEKTKIFGTEKIGDEEYPKKNINAIVALVIALAVIGSARAVDTILTALPQVALLVLVGLSFLLMLGIFAKPDGTFLESLQGSKYLQIFGAIMFVAVVLIFLGSIKVNGTDVSWLQYGYSFATQNYDGSVMGSIILFIVIIGAIFWITTGGKPKEKE